MRSEPETVQAVTTVPLKLRSCLLRHSGKDGFLTRTFAEATTGLGELATVPLPEGTPLSGALQKAAFLAEKALGVVTTRRGFGVRVCKEDFTTVIQKVRPEDYTRFVGERYEVTGLPCSMGPEGLATLLGAWRAMPLYSFKPIRVSRAWDVRAEAEPFVVKL